MGRDEFDLDIDSSKVSTMLKKAKRRQLLKITVISISLFIVLFFSFIIVISQLNNRAYLAMDRDLNMIRQITRPNTERGIAITSNGVFKSTVEYKTYKVIEGKPVKWEDEVYEYKVWNTFRQLSNVNPLTIADNVVIGNERINKTSELYNNQTMEREMQFYLPFASYNSYINDIGKVKGENKVAEFAISFDKPYKVSEIKEMLPEGVHPVWYWVDTYYDKKSYHIDDMTESAYNVYGFKAKPGDIEFGNGTEKDFLLAIQNGLEQKGKYYGEYERIYDYLKGKKTKPSEEDVKVIGVVVTGTAADLQQLNGQNYVKAAVLGATAENK
ncbi:MULTISPECIES: anti sigma factor C-terminal domain-containing protein [Bacillus]|uniref:Alkaline phosphatase n=1 Tax=Bacillus cereus TaxID=1396 RepID=A0A2A8IVV9_BACCE|nr:MULTISPECIES: anti sigma factor C-terminal domain-containing protein [Bacillus]MDH4424180.1 anti sigma factor C-terminal domain-containing protein [Bacillus cereus]PER23799.1 alkaline phosphatase [Bacillus cereus]PFA63767.1 alkaline phosphatase [Bacillus sp. AFS015896]PGL77865.1 alkaline phosphatase [Bacillus sp. AFS054943]PGU00986.1 alkaline phosphatase [Bacillus cereus]